MPHLEPESDLLRTLQEGTTVQSLILSKDRFPTMEMATKWVTDNDFRIDKVDETENSFRFRQREPEEFKDDAFGTEGKFRTIDLTTGVKAVIGFLKETSSELEGEDEKPMRFSEKNLKLSLDLSNIKLDEGKGVWIDFMRVVKGHVHAIAGEVNISKIDLADFKRNFDLGIPKKELSIDYFHENLKEASGWLRELRLLHDGETLQGFIEFTPVAKKKITDGELKFFSPEFSRIFKQKNGEVLRNVILGGGLTNRPFLDMNPIDSSSIKLSENLSLIFKKNKGDKKPMINKEPKGPMDVQKLTEMVNTLADDKRNLSEKYNDLSTKLSDVVNGYKDISTENKKLVTQLSDFQKDKEAEDFESAFSTLLSEGKVIPSKKEAMKAKFSAKELNEMYSDMPPVLSMTDIGSSGGESSDKLTTQEREVVRLTELTEEDIIKNRTFK